MTKKEIGKNKREREKVVSKNIKKKEIEEQKENKKRMKSRGREKSCK